MNIKSTWIIFSVLFLALCHIINVVHSVETGYYTYRINDLLSCSLCPPGTYFGKDCSSSTPTICYPCPVDHYTDVYNKYPKCSRCSNSPLQHGQITQNCTATTNRKWECNPGYYTDGEGHPCKPQKVCEVGKGASIPGSPNQKADCTACPNGTYSDVRSSTHKCQPFPKCADYGINVQQIRAGNSTHEPECGCLPCGKREKFSAAFYAILGVLVFLAALLVVSNGLWVYFLFRRYRKTSKWQPEQDSRLGDSTTRDTTANGKANRRSDTSAPLLTPVIGHAQDEGETSLLQNSTAVPDNPFLWQLSGDIGNEYETLATILLVPKPTVQQIQMAKTGSGNIRHSIFETLQYWRDKCQTTPRSSTEKYDMLAGALEKLEMNDLAEQVRHKSEEETEVSV